MNPEKNDSCHPYQLKKNVKMESIDRFSCLVVWYRTRQHGARAQPADTGLHRAVIFEYTQFDV